MGRGKEQKEQIKCCKCRLLFVPDHGLRPAYYLRGYVWPTCSLTDYSVEHAPWEVARGIQGKHKP